jgi:hypothetical protein
METYFVLPRYATILNEQLTQTLIVPRTTMTNIPRTSQVHCYQIQILWTPLAPQISCMHHIIHCNRTYFLYTSTTLYDPYQFHICQIPSHAIISTHGWAQKCFFTLALLPHAKRISKKLATFDIIALHVLQDPTNTNNTHILGIQT